MSNPINPEDYKAPDIQKNLELAGFEVAPTGAVNLPYQRRMLELVERLQHCKPVLFHQTRRNGKTNLVNNLFKKLEQWKPNSSVEPNESKTRDDEVEAIIMQQSLDSLYNIDPLVQVLQLSTRTDAKGIKE